MARMLYLRDIEVDVHVRCRDCGHEGVLPRAAMLRRFGPSYPVLSIAPHYRCSKCDSRSTESRPAPPALDKLHGGPAVEAAPSFDGPLAALQGLLDAVRSRGGDGDGDGDDAPASPEPPPRTATPPVRQPELRPLRLEQLIADGPPLLEPGRRPLWEPVSLADMAGHGEEEDIGKPPPATPAKDALPSAFTEAEDEPDGDRETDREEERDDLSFDQTIAALRTIFEGRGEPVARPPESPRPLVPSPVPAPLPDPADLDAGDLDAADLDVADLEVGGEIENDGENREDEDEHGGWPGFAISDPERSGPANARHDEDPADGEADADEPENEEIIAFAIRDPDTPSPARPSPVRKRAPAADAEPLDRTFAALRAMVQEAAADRDDPAELDVAGPDEAWQDDAGQDDAGQDDAWPDESARPDDAGAPVALEESAGDDAPVGRKSAQEMDMEEALRALRALVEQEEDLDEPPRPRTAPRPAWMDDDTDELGDDPEEGDPEEAPPGFKPLPQRLSPAKGGAKPDHAVDTADLGDDLDNDLPDEEPLDLVDILAPEEKARPADSNPPATKREPSTGEGTALDKTIAALRHMLELDGKRGP